ncbi:MAG: lipopolysaccharide biosynthesis protein [Myxococcota bacterium]|nr:lipopolysaccharide biosynthesis protein [Myxococcota bacterium]
MTPPPTEIGRKLRGGILWTALGTGVSNLIRIAQITILGRLLSASEFGVIAAGLTVLAFLRAISDLGVGLALVQHRSPRAEHIGTAFTVSLVLGAGLAVGLLLGAPEVASLFRRPELVDTLRALSVLVLVRGCGSISLLLCQRAMDFRTSAMVDLMGFTLGAIVSIAAAWGGAGPWALVYGYVVESLLTTAILLVRYPPGRPRFDGAAFRELFRFGAGQTLEGIATIVAQQGDYAVVTRYLGTSALGFYTRAYELVTYPAKLFSSILGSVLFPAFSRLQDDRPALAEAYGRTLFVNAIVLLPASLLMIVVAPEVLRVLLGPGWDASVLPFRVLLVGMLFRTSYKVGAIVSRARGAVYFVAVTQILYAGCVVGGALYAVRWGVEGVALTTTIAIMIQFVLLSCGAAVHADIPLYRLVQVHIPALFTTAGAALCGLPMAYAIRAQTDSAVLVVLATMGVGALGALAVAYVGVRRGHPLWSWTWGQLRKAKSRRRRQPPGLEGSP